MKRKKLYIGNWKLKLVVILIFLSLLIIIARLFYIQILDADYYQEIAEKQHIKSGVVIKAERGNIYDRNNNLLATNIQSISFAIDPKILSDQNTRQYICERLSKITRLPASFYLDKIRDYEKSTQSKATFVWLARGLLPNECDGLDTLKIHGFIKIKEPKRVYIYNEVASHLIGCTNIDNKGLMGIELLYDSLLKGKSGKMMMYRDKTGKLRPAIDMQYEPAINGASIYLTIDIELQKIVEYELKEGVIKANANSGTAVAMNPKTGEILALCSYPTFNPNKIEEITTENSKLRAITDIFEPGSTIKAIIASAAFEERIFNKNTPVDGNNGIYYIRNTKITDDHPLGKTTFKVAFENSSNIVLSKLALFMDKKKLYKYIRDFGFGILTNIDLPGEVSGKIKKLDELDSISIAFMSFGYGISCTPLQLLVAYSTIANGGKMMKPSIVQKIVDNDDKTISEFTPREVRNVISDSTAKKITELLVSVVENGTGKNAKVEGIKIAGKTGTSQQFQDSSYSSYYYNASFVGFAPADNPEICMIIVLDKPQTNIYGGATSAPIFRNIIKRWLMLKK